MRRARGRAAGRRVVTLALEPRDGPSRAMQVLSPLIAVGLTVVTGL